MATTVFPHERTAFPPVRPYNDFLPEDGKVYPRLEAVIDDRSCSGESTVGPSSR